MRDGKQKTEGSGSGPLVALANSVVRHPWRVLAGTLLFIVIAVFFGAPVAGLLKGGGFADPKSESLVAADRLRAATGINAEYGIIALVKLDTDYTSPATAAEVAGVSSRLIGDPSV
ncbi:MAG: hypothetical protein M3O87_00380, partial [Candidatus Dormibacteraeota bacterium]|nr:hypothetical protein [Candidatus Dormibacteraeota bacterium]